MVRDSLSANISGGGSLLWVPSWRILWLTPVGRQGAGMVLVANLLGYFLTFSKGNYPWRPLCQLHRLIPFLPFHELKGACMSRPGFFLAISTATLLGRFPGSPDDRALGGGLDPKRWRHTSPPWWNVQKLRASGCGGNVRSGAIIASQHGMWTGMMGLVVQPPLGTRGWVMGSFQAVLMLRPVQ